MNCQSQISRHPNTKHLAKSRSTTTTKCRQGSENDCLPHLIQADEFFCHCPIPVIFPPTQHPQSQAFPNCLARIISSLTLSNPKTFSSRGKSGTKPHTIPTPTPASTLQVGRFSKCSTAGRGATPAAAAAVTAAVFFSSRRRFSSARRLV